VDRPSAGLAEEDARFHQPLEFALDRALARPDLAGDLPEIERLVRPGQEQSQDRAPGFPKERTPAFW
jgi:hypothetical protein